MTALEFNYSLGQASKDLRPFALKLTKDVDDAKDLLQDTLMKAFLNRDKFEDGTNLKAWMYTIMRNTFNTNYQKMVRKKTFVDNTENLHYINSTAYTTHSGAYNTFAAEELDRAIGKLEELFRLPFVMYYNGYKYHEIAEYLTIPIGTVKNRIHIARKELKSRLSSYVDLILN